MMLEGHGIFWHMDVTCQQDRFEQLRLSSLTSMLSLQLWITQLSCNPNSIFILIWNLFIGKPTHYLLAHLFLVQMYYAQGRVYWHIVQAFTALDLYFQFLSEFGLSTQQEKYSQIRLSMVSSSSNGIFQIGWFSFEILYVE